MIKKILIANRGEIAVRVIKTAKEMGIGTVAVYSDADSNSLAVQMADEAYYIGPSPASQSYLDVKKIMIAIDESGADAVHPGYGFLSENYNFVETVEKAGIRFIGPGKDAIKSMGDKIVSKKIASKAGVNTVPGFMGEIATPEEAEKIAGEIGFPVMVKAAAGGGGRGMRIVHEKKEVKEAFKSAVQEAINNFNDGRIFIEKFIEKPRHIEIQVLADKKGNVVCLGERECSIQRYNQKVIEEAPSPFVTEEMRQKMYEQSKKLAKEVGYHSAGTVEYIVDSKRNFYFLEMNTRLQVEHPVTELITGLDLVKEMINVAADKEISVKQKDVKINGWAIESRIYAEDPARGFLPSSGRISKYKEPAESKNVRVDSGIYEGAEISMFYDSMIAKLCSYGKTRDEAIKHMLSSLSEYELEGISHNISFLEDIYSNPRFVKGDLTTNYIAEEYPEGFKLQEIKSEDHRKIIIIAAIIKWLDSNRNAKISGQMKGSEREINNKWAVCINDKIHIVDIEQKDIRKFKVNFLGETLDIELHWQLEDAIVRAKINGEGLAVKFYKVRNSMRYRFLYQGGQLEVLVVSPRAAELMKYMPDKQDDDNSKELQAPISGKIVDVKVKAGEKVKPGTPLIIIEAMKMENLIVAEHSSEVKSINVKKSDNVQTGEVVIEFK